MRLPHRLLVTLVFSIFFAAQLHSQSGFISVVPTYAIPIGDTSATFGSSVGADLQFGLPNFFGKIDGAFQVGYRAAMLEAGAGVVHVASVAGGPSFPLLQSGDIGLALGLGLGAYAAKYSDSSPLFNPLTSLQLSASVNLGSLKLGLSPGLDIMWARNSGQISSFYSAINFGLNLSIGLGGTAARPKLQIMPPNLHPYFPVIYKYYAANKVGEVEVTNLENVDANNVKVEFFIPRYMEGSAIVAEFPSLKPKESRTAPLTALLRNEVLDITETDAVQVEILVSYTARGNTFSIRRSANMRIESRNSVTWDDDRKVAAFVTAKDPTVLKLSRNAVAASGSGGAVFSEAFRKGMVAFIALAEYGLKYVVDPASSYESLSANALAVDFVQFPVQTLDYKTGDCDDLSVLYCSFLEALGIESAFVTTPGHILTAFALDMTELEAQRVFAGTDSLIVHGGKVWVPIEATLLSSGFLVAWTEGAKQWRDSVAGGTAGFIPVRDAWQVYEPTYIPKSESNDVVNRFPEVSRIGARFDREMKAFVERELAILEKSIQSRIAVRSTPGLLNSLGALYARYGAYDKAEASFLQASKSNNFQAFHNLGNIKFLKKDFRGALAQYEQALKLNQDFAEAALGVARSLFELGRLEPAAEAYKTARLIDPQKAAVYSYISNEASTTGRASDPGQRASVSWTD